MCSRVSSPTISIISNGPIGWFSPSLMALSMSCAEATPSCNIRKASLPMSALMRLVAKPGASFTRTVSLPIRTETSSIARTVSSLVSSPRMISTSLMISTGMKKCMPIVRSTRPVDAKISVILSEEVLLAKIVCGGQISSSLRKTSHLSARSSFTASITSSAPDAASKSADSVRFPAAVLALSASSLPRSTPFFILASSRARPFSRISMLRSMRMTR